MNVINMSMRPVQVNTKFLNILPPEWSKFFTDVKLARDLHTTNYDQLYSYLEQHEIHANETRLMRERYQDPLAFVANYNQPPHSSTSPSQQYQSHMDHQTSYVPQIAYHSPQTSTQPKIEFPQMDSGLAVPVFTQGDDPIACLNKAIAFLITVASSRFPSTNNQLRTSFNPRNQATIQDGRVTVQQIQGRQGQSYDGTGYKGNATSFVRNNTRGQTRVVKFYNCQGEGHMVRKCTQPKKNIIPKLRITPPSDKSLPLKIVKKQYLMSLSFAMTLGEAIDEEVSIDVTEELLIDAVHDPITSIIEFNYPDLSNNINDLSYFQEKTILAPTNEVVDTINDHLLNKFPGVPNHILALKVGVPIMLLGNIDHANGLCNGTRLQVLKLTRTSIHPQIINGTHFGKKVMIPRFSRKKHLDITSICLTILFKTIKFEDDNAWICLTILFKTIKFKDDNAWTFLILMATKLNCLSHA
ncbi:integrase, catalytic region, zinc finger, CCHC-type containing protein [Tanacetum coccineum]